MKTTILCALALVLGASGCKDDPPPATGDTAATGAPAPTGAPAATSAAAQPAPAAAGGMDCSSPRKTIESQVALIHKGGKVEDFAKCFTERQRGKITQQMLDKRHTEAKYYVLDKLYGEEEKKGDAEVKVKMPSGRTLTTLLKVGDEWHADTLWFK